jgi:hypothetical protein
MLEGEERTAADADHGKVSRLGHKKTALKGAVGRFADHAQPSGA